MSGTRPVRLFVNDFQIGGTERQCVALARALTAGDFAPSVSCLHLRGDFLAELRRGGVCVTEFAIPNLYGPKSMLERVRLVRDLARERVEVVHAFGFYANVFAIPAARLARVPVVLASVRDLGDLMTPAQWRVERAVCRLADRVVVNASAVADALVARGHDPGSISVVPNGIDLARFSGGETGDDVRRELGIPAGAQLVAVISRLNAIGGVEIKGVRYFLEAAALLAAGFPNAYFAVVGDGPCRAELQRYAARLGLGNRVVFTGFRNDVPRLLSQLSIFALPSLTEACSNGLLEAMAAGVAVVATRVGGNPELVEDGVTGLLVPKGDAAALARALGRLLHDDGLRAALAAAGRQRARDRFALDGLVRATERLYTALLEAARGTLRSAAMAQPQASRGESRT